MYVCVCVRSIFTFSFFLSFFLSLSLSLSFLSFFLSHICLQSSFQVLAGMVVAKFPTSDLAKL